MEVENMDLPDRGRLGWLVPLLCGVSVVSLLCAVYVSGIALGTQVALEPLAPTRDLIGAVYVLETKRFVPETEDDVLKARYIDFVNREFNGLLEPDRIEYGSPSGVPRLLLGDDVLESASVVVPVAYREPLFVFPEDLEVLDLSDGARLVRFKKSFLRLVPVGTRQLVAKYGGKYQLWPVWGKRGGRWLPVDAGRDSEYLNYDVVKEALASYAEDAH